LPAGRERIDERRGEADRWVVTGSRPVTALIASYMRRHTRRVLLVMTPGETKPCSDTLTDRQTDGGSTEYGSIAS